MLDKINHYSTINPASVYDEEALTALELSARTAGKVNQVVDAFNNLDKDTTSKLEKIPSIVSSEVKKLLDQGAFDEQIDEHTEELTEKIEEVETTLGGRLDALLGQVTEGSTSLDAEVIDTRVGADGTVYPNAGKAVRTQILDVETFTNAIYKKLGEAVEIPTTKLHAFRGDNGTLTYNSTIFSVYARVKSGRKIRVRSEGVVNRLSVCFSNSIENGATVSDSIKNSFADDYDTLTELETIVPSGYSYIIVSYYAGSSNPSTTVKLFDITEERAKTELNVIRPNIFNIGCEAGAVTANNVRGFAVRIQAGATYHIKVTGKHNRFYGYSTNTLMPRSSAQTVFNLGNGERYESEHTFTASNYQYLVVTLAYTGQGFEDDCTVEVYENYGSDLTVNGVKVVDGNNPEGVTSCYKTAYNVNDITTTDDVYALYNSLVEAYPDFAEVDNIGVDSNGKAIYEYLFGVDEYGYVNGKRSKDDIILGKPMILVVTGVHGDERSAIASAYQFFRDLCQSDNPLIQELRNRYGFKVIPVACPYSLDHNTRTNKNGVNVNRNFPTNWKQTSSGDDYGGARASDQSETLALEEWIANNRRALFLIDFHNSGYTEEVSYLAGDAKVFDWSEMAMCYYYAVDKVKPYWKREGLTNVNLIYAYTGFDGDFKNFASVSNYATSQGIQGLCLEASWNQNTDFGLHSNKTIGIGAEILGNMLIEFTNHKKGVFSRD